MSREAHVRFWESAGVQIPRATHLPLYRQESVFARNGFEIYRLTTSLWAGDLADLVKPSIKVIGDSLQRRTPHSAE